MLISFPLLCLYKYVIFFHWITYFWRIMLWGSDAYIPSLPMALNTGFVSHAQIPWYPASPSSWTNPSSLNSMFLPVSTIAHCDDAVHNVQKYIYYLRITREPFHGLISGPLSSTILRIYYLKIVTYNMKLMKRILQNLNSKVDSFALNSSIYATKCIIWKLKSRMTVNFLGSELVSLLRNAPLEGENKNLLRRKESWPNQYTFI